MRLITVHVPHPHPFILRPGVQVGEGERERETYFLASVKEGLIYGQN